MKVSDTYKSNSGFLSASDLQGKTIRLTISEIASHTFNEGQNDEKTQIVLSFEGKEKRLGLNVTNAKSIADKFGDDTDDWAGKEVKIYPTKTDFGGKTVDCIRIVEDVPEEFQDDEIPGF